jgi:hypothetical protein
MVPGSQMVAYAHIIIQPNENAKLTDNISILAEINIIIITKLDYNTNVIMWPDDNISLVIGNCLVG